MFFICINYNNAVVLLLFFSFLFCRLCRPLTLSEKVLYSHLDDPMGEVCSAVLLLLRSGVFMVFIIFSPFGMNGVCVCVWGGGCMCMLVCVCVWMHV